MTDLSVAILKNFNCDKISLKDRMGRKLVAFNSWLIHLVEKKYNSIEKETHTKINQIKIFQNSIFKPDNSGNITIRKTLSDPRNLSINSGILEIHSSNKGPEPQLAWPIHFKGFIKNNGHCKWRIVTETIRNVCGRKPNMELAN